MFQYFRVPRKFGEERERGVSRFSAESFLSHSAENFLRGSLYCCNTFRYRKNLDRRGEYQDFPWKMFCLTVPEKFVVEPFSVSIISSTEKVWRREGGCQDFPLKTFCLTVSKISVGQSFTVTTISGIEKFWIREGGGVARFSTESFLSHSCENFRRGILYCCNRFGYRKNLDKRGGGVSRFSVENVSSHCRKNS